MSGVAELSGGLIIKRFLDYDHSDECYYIVFERGMIHKPILLLDHADVEAITKLGQEEF